MAFPEPATSGWALTETATFPISVIQVADIMLFSRAVYKCTVDEAEFEWVPYSLFFLYPLPTSSDDGVEKQGHHPPSPSYLAHPLI